MAGWPRIGARRMEAQPKAVHDIKPDSTLNCPPDANARTDALIASTSPIEPLVARARDRLAGRLHHRQAAYRRSAGEVQPRRLQIQRCGGPGGDPPGRAGLPQGDQSAGTPLVQRLLHQYPHADHGCQRPAAGAPEAGTAEHRPLPGEPDPGHRRLLRPGQPAWPADRRQRLRRHPGALGRPGRRFPDVAVLRPQHRARYLAPAGRQLLLRSVEPVRKQPSLQRPAVSAAGDVSGDLAFARHRRGELPAVRLRPLRIHPRRVPAAAPVQDLRRQPAGRGHPADAGSGRAELRSRRTAGPAAPVGKQASGQGEPAAGNRCWYCAVEEGAAGPFFHCGPADSPIRRSGDRPRRPAPAPACRPACARPAMPARAALRRP